MAKNINIGTLFRRPLNAQGEIGSKVPFILKTLAAVVFRNDGTTVESSLSTIETNVTKATPQTFATVAAYQAALAAHTIDSNTLAVITSDMSSNS